MTMNLFGKKMKKSAIMLIALFLGGLLAAVLIPAMRARDDSVPATTVHMEAILLAMQYFADHVGPLPTNGTAAIFSALRGSNPKSLAVLADTDGQPDRMLDPWGQPYQILIHQDGTFQVTSGGSNGVLGDDDDKVMRSEPNVSPERSQKWSSKGLASISSDRSARGWTARWNP